MGNFNWTNMRIAFAFAFLFIACFVGSEFVNAIPNQELGHDADAVVPEAPPAEFAQGLYDAKELYKKCGSRPVCPTAHCNHMRRVCRQRNFNRDCRYEPDHSMNASCMSNKAKCDTKMRVYERCTRNFGNKSQNKSNPPPPPPPPPAPANPSRCGPRPTCLSPSCNYKKYECRQVNFNRDCGYRPDHSRNASCRSRKALCNQRQRQWQDCKLRLRGLKL